MATNSITDINSDIFWNACFITRRVKRSSNILELVDDTADRRSDSRLLMPAKAVQIDKSLILNFNILYRFWSQLTRAYLYKKSFPNCFIACYNWQLKKIHNRNSFHLTANFCDRTRTKLSCRTQTIFILWHFNCHNHNTSLKHNHTENDNFCVHKRLTVRKKDVLMCRKHTHETYWQWLIDLV